MLLFYKNKIVIIIIFIIIKYNVAGKISTKYEIKQIYHDLVLNLLNLKIWSSDMLWLLLRLLLLLFFFLILVENYIIL